MEAVVMVLQVLLMVESAGRQEMQALRRSQVVGGVTGQRGPIHTSAAPGGVRSASDQLVVRRPGQNSSEHSGSRRGARPEQAPMFEAQAGHPRADACHPDVSA